MREAQKQELKTTSFNNITQSDAVSKTYALKKYMGWSDIEVLANREFMRKDIGFLWELEQIKSGGPNWRDNMQAAAPAAGGELTAGGGGGGAPAGTPPAFGPAPAAGGEAPAPAPGPEATPGAAAPSPEVPPATPAA